MKIKVTISIEQNTADRLKQIAYENHMNVSQYITQHVWKTKVKYENLPGQEKLRGGQA